VDEAGLIARCKHGDEQAFRELYERYQPMTCRVAYSIVRDRARSEDVVQDAFLQAFRSIRNLRPGEAFGPWFYRVVVHKARRAMRTRKLLFLSLDSFREEGLEPADPAAAELPAQVGDRDALWRAMDHLSPAHREALTLKYVADLTDDEVAQVTGVPAGTVKSRLHHAKARLAERLRREGLDSPARRPLDSPILHGR
jgi:RNA polymerase sigma-70 factor (ECF subfamily)